MSVHGWSTARQPALAHPSVTAVVRFIERVVPAELFPTHVRATAVSFCNGTGRIVTSTGPLIAGLLVGYFSGFTQGAAIMTCFALFSILAMFLGRETREDPLPR
jgi:hypothetical protein